MTTGLEDYEIYVQILPAPPIFGAHPCTDLTVRLSQGEIKAAVAGFLFGAGLSNYFFPFFASQAEEMARKAMSDKKDFLVELAERGYILPERHDPIMFAYKPKDEQHSLKNLTNSFDETIDYQLGFYFNMARVEKQK
ncbi:MAG: hypothetical protein WC852_07600 [Candidatus Nanoarchaeia archaeon]|jgi:hypothetical protein